MPKMLKSILKRFQNEIDYSLKLVLVVEEVSRSYKPPKSKKLSQKEVRLIAELAFLKIFVAYEQFMEQAFIGYMLGQSSIKKYKPIKYVSPKNEEHARKMTLQDYTEYTDWSTPDKVKRRAEYCFKKGEPFNKSISSYQQIIQDIKTIRNDITHSSSDAHDKFINLVRRYLTTLPPNKPINVGDFLLQIKPDSKTPVNFITFFSNQLNELSESIIP